MKCIYYKAGYKYQLYKEYQVQLSFKPLGAILCEWISLDIDGVLTIRKDYAWDGPSGPTIDTLDFMRGSLVHDALYQLIRDGFLSAEPYRKLADIELQKICREDEMLWIRTQWVYQGVRFGGGAAADASNTKKIIAAPAKCGE